MMKRIISIIAALLMMAFMFAACDKTETPVSEEKENVKTEEKQAEATAEKKESTKTIQFFAMNTAVVDGLNLLVPGFEEENAGYKVDVVALPGVAEYNAAMAAKLAAGDVPDMMSYQWGTQIQLYAQGGHLMALDDMGIADKINPIASDINQYEGKTYAYPIAQSMFGMLYNQDLAAEYGVSEIPEKFDDFIAALDTMKSNGLEAPIVFPAKDGSGATGFVFCYLHQITSQKVDDYYGKMLSGESSWDGPEMTEVLQKYEQVLQYSNEDRLGMDPDTAMQRFAKGETAVYIGGTWLIKSLRTMNPDLDFKLIPPPLGSENEKYLAISDFDETCSISATTENPEVCIAFINKMYSKEGGETMAAALSSISVVKDAIANYDPAITDYMYLLNEGNFIGYSERVWIPGIKEIMKKNVQEWMAGVDMPTALANLEKEHQRLLGEKPEFVEAYFGK